MKAQIHPYRRSLRLTQNLAKMASIIIAANKELVKQTSAAETAEDLDEIIDATVERLRRSFAAAIGESTPPPCSYAQAMRDEYGPGTPD